MQLMDQEFKTLIARGIQNGYLTYEEVNSYLPDEDVSPEKLDKLLLAIERHDIQLTEASDLQRKIDASKTPEPNVAEMRGAGEKPAAAEPAPLVTTELPRPSEDPIRMYLSQMAEIPLLSREEEIALAKKIEITRRQYRRSLLESRLCDASNRQYIASSPQR